MKILHLIYSQQVAGAEKYLLDLLPGLKENGIDCSLICVIPEADQHKFTAFCDALNNKGVPAEIFVAGRFNFLTVAKRISQYLVKNGIQYIHAHLFKSDFLAVLVKKIYNRKVVLLSTKHGYQEKYFNNYDANKGKINYDLYYFISKFINRNIDHQVTISKAMSDLYYHLKLTATPIPYIHHGISIEPIPQAGGSRLAEPQLIIVGRVEEIKGHTYLLQAMPAVVKQFPAVKLLVLGNGTAKEKLQLQAKQLGIETNVDFMGFQQNPYAFIAASDIIILPSLYEPFGLVYIESFALQTPVIAFDVQACNEIITNNETGILVTKADSNALAEKIIYLLENPAERKRLSDNAYQQYKAHFNTARMVTDTLAWYHSILSV